MWVCYLSQARTPNLHEWQESSASRRYRRTFNSYDFAKTFDVINSNFEVNLRQIVCLIVINKFYQQLEILSFLKKLKIFSDSLLNKKGAYNIFSKLHSFWEINYESFAKTRCWKFAVLCYYTILNFFVTWVKLILCYLNVYFESIIFGFWLNRDFRITKVEKRSVYLVVLHVLFQLLVLAFDTVYRYSTYRFWYFSTHCRRGSGIWITDSAEILG